MRLSSSQRQAIDDAATKMRGRDSAHTRISRTPVPCAFSRAGKPHTITITCSGQGVPQAIYATCDTRSTKEREALHLLHGAKADCCSDVAAMLRRKGPVRLDSRTYAFFRDSAITNYRESVRDYRDNCTTAESNDPNELSRYPIIKKLETLMIKSIASATGFQFRVRVPAYGMLPDLPTQTVMVGAPEGGVYRSVMLCGAGSEGWWNGIPEAHRVIGATHAITGLLWLTPHASAKRGIDIAMEGFCVVCGKRTWLPGTPEKKRATAINRHLHSIGHAQNTAAVFETLRTFLNDRWPPEYVFSMIRKYGRQE
jgi:hypothetical protein